MNKLRKISNMDNEQSTVDLSFIFDEARKIPSEVKQDVVKLSINTIFTGEEEIYYIIFDNNCMMKFTTCPPKNFQGNTIKWEPNSQMIDFEVYGEFSSNEKFLRQGQVVGVIIHEPTNYYTKLCWNTEYIHNEDLYQIYSERCSIWSLRDNCYETINSDLNLGLDVLY